MAFIGAIKQDVRSILSDVAQKWRNHPVFVGCSGNFTIERVLASAGVTTLHSNDVSLYSCAIGAHLTGQPFEVRLRDDADGYGWLRPYLTPGVPTIATLLLAMEYLKYSERGEAYHRRIAHGYKTQWQRLQVDTVAKVTKALTDLRVASFTPADVVSFIASAPEDAVAIAFPPSGEDTYEKLYAALQRVFEWNGPSYLPFSDARCLELAESMRSKAAWLLLREKAIEDLTPFLMAHVQKRPDSLFVYGGSGNDRSFLVDVHRKTDPVPWSRLEGLIVDPLRLVRLTPGQLDLLRMEYLAPTITNTASADVRLGILAGDALVGVLAFRRSTYGGIDTAYMVSDFPMRPSVYLRLSKLIVAVALSTEVKALLEQAFTQRINHINHITTTAFTKRPNSMKYRGLLEVWNRKEGVVNYGAAAGRWSLADALSWWQRTQAERAGSIDTADTEEPCKP